MKNSPALPGGLLESKPTSPNTFGYSATSAFLVLGDKRRSCVVRSRFWKRLVLVFWLTNRQEGSESQANHSPSQVVHGVQMTQEPKQRATEQVRNIPKSCGMGLNPELQALPEPGNVAADEVHDDLTEIDAMISEGSPTR